MPLSATASSTQSPLSAILRTRSATSPSFVNLQALLRRLSRICLTRMESAVSAPRFSCASTQPLNCCAVLLSGNVSTSFVMRAMADHAASPALPLLALRLFVASRLLHGLKLLPGLLLGIAVAAGGHH